MKNNTFEVPKPLSTWFIIHFIADISFALPLLIIPMQFLSFLGWQNIDPIATRLVAAALFGIGIESLLGRNASPDSFKSMLNLKIIWSTSAIIGIAVSLIGEAHSRPIGAWMILVIFAAFNCNWVYWRIRIHTLLSEDAHPRLTSK